MLTKKQFSVYSRLSAIIMSSIILIAFEFTGITQMIVVFIFTYIAILFMIRSTEMFKDLL